jgi:hypothetical protein
MTRKRYSEKKGLGLLAELVLLARDGEGVSTSSEAARLKRTLEKLLTSSEIATDAGVIEEVRTWSIGEVDAWRVTSSAFFVAFGAKNKGLNIDQFVPCHVDLSPMRLGGRMRLVVRGRPWFVLLYHFVNLLMVAGVDRLQLCECSQPFVKMGRREFCSARCQKRYYMRQLRAAEKKGAQRGKTTRSR